MTQRMAITGASGFIGRQLVPRLKARGFELTVVGRDPKRLGKLFPDVRRCRYGQIAEFAEDFDVLIHLAVLNNDRSESEKAFEKANVGLLSDVIDEAKQAGIKTFVNVTTFQALNAGNSPYAESKRRALEFVNQVNGVRIINLFLPPVYGDDFAGKLSFLKKVPNSLRPAALTLVSAMVPTLHIDRLTGFLVKCRDDAEKRVLLANNQDNNPAYRFGKKMIELASALTLVMVFWWLLALIWLAVSVTSKGPGIFAQKRVGRYGKTFTCYKFRTMKVGTMQAGTHEVSTTVVTSVGTFLRKSKLDELPQIVNILRGELSLVGPRPCLPSQKALLAARKRLGILNIPPGITGLSQIQGVDMSDPEKLAQMDAFYLFQRGLLFEFKIILSTFLGRGRGDNVKE